MTPNLHMPQEEVLLQLLIKEHGYYRSVYDIALEENSRLKAQKPLGELQPLLRQKQIILSCIQSIDKALAPLKKLWQTKQDRSDPISAKIQEELASLNKLLGEILQLDLASQKFAEKHLEELKKRTVQSKEAP